VLRFSGTGGLAALWLKQAQKNRQWHQQLAASFIFNMMEPFYSPYPRTIAGRKNVTGRFSRNWLAPTIPSDKVQSAVI
jgi:hypothetical protein